VDVTLVLTHDCNLGCDYCFAGEKRRQTMCDDVLWKSLDLAFSDGSERVELSFFGGEPLLEWELLVRAVQLAEARAADTGRTLVLGVTTNGTLLDAARVQFLVEHAVHVGLSIDGTRAAHEATRPTRGGRSSFDATLAGLDRLIAAGARLMTVSVIDPRNVQLLGESVRFIVSRGVRRLALNPNYGAQWSDAALAEWRRGYDELAALWVERRLSPAPIYVNVVDDKLVLAAKGGHDAGDHCAMGHGAIAVAPSGNLYGCERLVGDDRDATLRLGDVFRGLDRGRQLCLDAQLGPVNPECGGCGVRGRCGSSCACANRAETGELGVAGGVQCWHEQTAIDVADAAAARVWRARDRRFVARLRGEAA
jgi:uncharacterized protein